jgi:hypothetical protein
MAPAGKKGGKGGKDEAEAAAPVQLPKAGRGVWRLAQAGGEAVYRGEWRDCAPEAGDLSPPASPAPGDAPPAAAATAPQFVPKQHGRGVLSFANGDSFDGQWAEGRMVFGRYLFAGGASYEGGFGRSGHFSGRGVLRLISGDEYDGDWAEGLMHGQGTLRLAGDRTEWSGAFERGSFKGLDGRLTSLPVDPLSLPPTLRHLIKATEDGK